MANIIIYSTVVCPYCIKAKQLLESKGVQYKEILIDKEANKRDEMLSLSNGRRTVPQIFINGQHIGGFDDLKALNDRGGLDPLLASEA
jgi:glutaredoxin 3